MSPTKKAASTQPCPASGELGLPENVIDRAKEVLHQLESGHQPAESVQEVPVATSVPAKTRKKAVSDADAGQMSLFG